MADPAAAAQHDHDRAHPVRAGLPVDAARRRRRRRPAALVGGGAVHRRDRDRRHRRLDRARRYEIVTDLGKLLDPIADKVLTGFAFIGLSILGELPWWITIVVLIREVGHHGPPASWSRATTWSRPHGWASSRRSRRRVALSLALLPLWTLVGDWIFWVNGVTMTIAVLLTVASGIDYVVTEVRGRAAGAGAPRDDDRPARLDASAAGARSRLATGWTVGVAESLTGGLRGRGARRRCPARPPSVRGGVVAYATDAQASAAGRGRRRCSPRRARCIPEVARQMAEGVRDASRRRTAVRTSGSRRRASRGPTPQDGQPVGTVHIAVATPDGTRVESLELAGHASADPQPRRSRAALRSGARGNCESPSSGNRQCFELGYIRRFPPIPQRTGLDWHSSGVVLLSTRTRRNQK